MYVGDVLVRVVNELLYKYRKGNKVRSKYRNQMDDGKNIIIGEA